MKEIRAKITTWLVYSYSDDANIEEIAAEIEAGTHPADFEDFQEVTSIYDFEDFQEVTSIYAFEELTGEFSYKNEKGETVEFKNYESN